MSSRPDQFRVWLLSAIGLALLGLQARSLLLAEVSLPGAGASLLQAAGKSLATVLVVAALARLMRRRPGPALPVLGSTRILVLGVLVVLLGLGWRRIWPLYSAEGSHHEPLPGETLALHGSDRTSLAWVSVDAARDPGSPPGAVLLAADDGTSVTPLQPSVPDDGRWHRLNFPAPRAPFQIAVKGPVRLRNAVTYGSADRLSEKLLSAWRVPLLAAALCVAAALLATRDSPAFRLGWMTQEASRLPWIALLGYVVFLGAYLDTYAGGSDSSGYLNSARLLEHLHVDASLPRPADAAALPARIFVPPGFVLRPDGATISPTYPVGLPILICLSSWLLPARAALPAVILLHLAAGIVLIFCLGRRLGLSPPRALTAAMWLALCPLYIFMGLQTMSDVPALVWVLAAITLSDRRPLFAGMATAVAIMIRPSNVLALPAILLALGLRPRALALWALGGLPFGIAEALYNARLYGHPFVTGYGNPGSLIAASWIAPTLRHYVIWLPTLLTPAVVLAVVFPFRRSLAGRLRLLLAVWAGAYLAFYSTYSCTHETWWYLRFLLPAVPPLILASLLALQGIRLARAGAAACLLVGVAWLGTEDRSLGVLDSAQGNRVYLDSSAWLAAHAPANSVVACNITAGALYHYTSLLFAGPENEDDAAALSAYARDRGRPLYAEFFRFDQAPLAWYRGGRWSEVHRSGDIIIWRWLRSSQDPQ